MGRQFRVRVRAKNAPAKIRKGGCSSSCPSYSKNRELAKAARAAFKQRLIAIDDVPETKKRRRGDSELADPLGEMDLHKTDLKKTRSVQFLDEMDNDDEKEVEPYPSVIMSPAELDNKLNLLGQLLTSAINNQTNQQTKLMGEIRSVLTKVKSLGSPKEHSEVVAKYAKNFLPIFFRIYTNVHPKFDDRPVINDKHLKLSAFETVRMFLPFVNTQLIDTHINLALKKMKDSEISDEKKLLITDIIIALLQQAGFQSADAVFSYIYPWFLSEPSRKSPQKKAYRILVELYKRRDEPELEAFFNKIEPTVADIINLDEKKISEPAWASRLAVFRLILRSLDSLDKCEKFYDIILNQLIVGMDRSHNSLTRKNAAKCFQELIDSMMEFANLNEEGSTLKVQILDSVETRIFEFSAFKAKSADIPLEKARATLIAMNIFAQQHLKTMNGALVSRFLNHSTLFLKDKRPVIRVLAIRLIRIFCKKLPDFMINQFQDYILDSVFQYQPENENTSTIRKANRFLFETMIEKFGYEVVCKYVTGNAGILKFLKKLEKTRRRKLTQGSRRKGEIKHDESDEDGESEAMTAMTSKTLRADSIFNLIEQSDEESNEDDDDVKSRVAQSAISIKAYRKFVLDGDRNAAASKTEVKTEKLPKGIRMAKDGRLIIEDEEDVNMEDEESEDENDY